MTSMTERAGLKVAPQLAAFIEDRALLGTGIDADAFWRGTAAIFAKFAPENAALLARRDALQARIDAWHREKAGQPRSEEHTSELQSLMRISYAVFCLKKKKTK